MDDRNFRILIILKIVKQLYNNQSKKLPKMERIFNVKNKIKKEQLIIDLNMSNKQLDTMIMNIVNYGYIKEKMKPIATKKRTPKRKRSIRKKKRSKFINMSDKQLNIPTYSITIKKKKIYYADDNINTLVLVDNMIKEDTEYNRELLRNTVVYRLNNGSYKQLDTIYSIFYKAIKNNNVSLLNVLVDADIDVDSQDEDGNTGLHYAVYFKRINSIIILLQNESNINLKNKYGYTPKDLITNGLLYNIEGGSEEDMLNLLNYRKKRTFKINTSVSLFGNHDNLININNETELSKIKEHKGILVFYMIKCGWCKKMQEDIKILCNRGVKVYVMENAQLTPSIRNKYDIRGFPTIYILKNGKHHKYNGNRSYKDFENKIK